MATDLRPPIILFGNTRSGTTILQNVLAEHPDVVAWYEPRTLWLVADPGRRHDEFDEADATPRARRYVRRRFLAYQRRHGDRVVMEKTPANVLKIPYVRAIFPEATYLYIVRNPFSYISSVELKWQKPVSAKGIRRRLRSTPLTQLPYYAGRLLEQQLNKRVLGRKYLGVWGARYRGMDQDLKSTDLLTVIARQWARASRKAEQDLAAFEPGRVLRLRYEDFVQDPVRDIERIFDHAGLPPSEEASTAAREWVKGDRQTKWRRFDPVELARIVPELRDEMARHGYDIPDAVARAAASPARPDVAPEPDPGARPGAG